MNSWMISGIILLVGFFICLVLILRAKWKSGRKNIDDYQRGRDKLTFREKKKKKESSQSESGIDIVNIIGGFFTLLIGLFLMPTIVEEMGNACTNEFNVNSTANIMLCSSNGEPGGLLVLAAILFALSMVSVVLVTIIRSFRSTGLL